MIAGGVTVAVNMVDTSPVMIDTTLVSGDFSRISHSCSCHLLKF